MSEKWHSVQLVKSGRRRTLVTELWLPHEDDYDDWSPSHVVEAARQELHEIYRHLPLPARSTKIERMLRKFAGVETELVTEIRAKVARGEVVGACRTPSTTCAVAAADPTAIDL